MLLSGLLFAVLLGAGLADAQDTASVDIANLILAPVAVDRLQKFTSNAAFLYDFNTSTQGITSGKGSLG
jgi:hypothetical protein